ncbi:MAG: helix-turn-helix domain-containing protein [Polyangiaceae bacterium]
MPPARRKRRTSWRSAARSSPQVDRALAALGKRVRILRREKGLTQEDAAAKAHLDSKHFQAIEAGQANLTMASLVGVARSLGVKLSELFKGV